MKIVCISVGKRHEPGVAELVSEYEKRLKHYCEFEWQLIPVSDKSLESQAILSKLQPNDTVVLLDEAGAQLTNEQLAVFLENCQNHSVSRLVFIIGGAYGVSDEVKKIAGKAISLSKLVFPHQLVRVILAEQLYRSYSIISGGKYHHQ